ncbi:hypothetical protein M8J76_013390 [Diaphorina citri]|nr:hypothetical protein M8J76_013390 [Diaphorina citri]
MALESSTQWLAQAKSSSHPEPIFITEHREANIIKVPKLILTQSVQSNRFTQAEQGSTAINYRTNCVQNENQQQAHKEMFDPNMQQSQQQAQMYVVDKKNSDAKVSSVSEFPFCYNVNMLQKQANNSGSSNLSTAISSDDKGCYRFDVGQPFTYNYALVNQMSLAAAANSAQFKCEVCGLVFGHLSLLNHHKRIHNAAAVTTTSTSSNNSNAIQSQSQVETRTYSCEQCGSCFNNSSELKSHKLTAHPKPKNCNTCGVELDCEHYKGKKKYINKGQHPVKRRGMATVTKCHKCNGSGIIFVGATHLKNHAKVHTGEKPHHCDICDVGFSDKFALKRHRLIHEKYARNSTVNQSHDSQTTPPQSTPTHSSSQLEEWKCEVSNNIAFPGCSRPPDSK